MDFDLFTHLCGKNPLLRYLCIFSHGGKDTEIISWHWYLLVLTRKYPWFRVLVYTQQELLKEKMNLSEVCRSQNGWEVAVLWGQGAKFCPRLGLGNGADLPGSGARPSCAEVQALLLPPEGRAVAAPLPLSPLEEPGRGWSRTQRFLCAEQPDPRHPVQLGNAFI